MNFAASVPIRILDTRDTGICIHGRDSNGASCGVAAIGVASLTVSKR